MTSAATLHIPRALGPSGLPVVSEFKIEVVMIRAKSPDPLEFHRVVPANMGTDAVLAFCNTCKAPSRSGVPGIGGEY